jgi:predicted RNA-binding protein
VFDHIKHIRESKLPDYYESLTEEDQKTFNKYVILMGLSMDQSAIQGDRKSVV